MNATRTTKVDGFTYSTTAPERPRQQLPVSHYVELAQSAALGTDTTAGTVTR